MTHGIPGVFKKSMNRISISAVLAFFLWLLFVASTPLCALDGNGPRCGIRPLDQNGRMRVGPKDRCPVCGMKVIRYPKFSSAIQLKDHDTYYFCSTGCMIRSWMHPEIYLGTKSSELKRPVVKEYFTGRQVDARDIIFVSGSDIIGPMGPALVPVLDENYLKVLIKRHGAKKHFLLKDVNDANWFDMTGKKVRH